MQHTVTFTGEDINATVQVPTNSLLADAAHLAGIDIGQPCGGQGRCGRCAVQVTEGTVRRRSTLRLSPTDVDQGYALACQTVVEGNVAIYVPPQEKIERRLTTDRVVAEVARAVQLAVADSTGISEVLSAPTRCVTRAEWGALLRAHQWPCLVR